MISIMKLADHGCGRYPSVFLQEGWHEGCSGDFTMQLAHLPGKLGGVYQYL